MVASSYQAHRKRGPQSVSSPCSGRAASGAPLKDDVGDRRLRGGATRLLQRGTTRTLCRLKGGMPYRILTATPTPPPKVARVIWKLEQHYLRPVHAIFRLPVSNYRLVGQFQFAIAHLLLGAIAGVSTTLYTNTAGNGNRFRGLLIEHYPIASEPGNVVSIQDAARTLWSIFRNPLAHDLGYDLEKKAKTPQVKVFRVLTKHGARGLTETRIDALENTSVRPVLKPTLMIRSDATVLSVDALYWGVRRTIENLLTDTARIRAAEVRLP